jgi:hypothetical protein
MRLYIPTIIQKRLGLPAMVDTDTMNQDQIKKLYGALCDLSEQVDLVKPGDREEFQEEITALTSTLIDAIELPADPAPPRKAVPASVSKDKVAIAHQGKIKNLRANFGTSVHDQMHFAPTDQKSYHGVWGTSKLAKVRQWVRMAVDSIWAGDQYVVASKAGEKGGRTYLVFMNTTVGYLSGSAMLNKPKQLATHIEVFVDAKGNTVSAFPSDPSIF